MHGYTLASTLRNNPWSVWMAATATTVRCLQFFFSSEISWFPLPFRTKLNTLCCVRPKRSEQPIGWWEGERVRTHFTIYSRLWLRFMFTRIVPLSMSALSWIQYEINTRFICFIKHHSNILLNDFSGAFFRFILLYRHKTRPPSSSLSSSASNNNKKANHRKS